VLRRKPVRRRPSVKPRTRRTAALSADFDAFLTEVAAAVSAAMSVGRWQDLAPAVRAYARRLGVLDPGRVFNAAIAHRLVCHALTLTDPAQFDEVLGGVASALKAVHHAQPLEEAIQDHRRMHEHYRAFSAFAAITAAEGEVH
jgi:hypothetical protein